MRGIAHSVLVEIDREVIVLLTVEETNYLCRVGPGTPMGNLMRRYWTPILLSKELPEADGAPLRSRILGEDLVAYRDTNGDVGLLDNFCPHRRASLFFGRNEECGLRCVYHGWKFDKDGNCIDMPSEPAESNFKDKVKIKSYPVKEGGGLIWAYMGPAELEPQMPGFEYIGLEMDQVSVSKLRYESNYVQVVEGDIDTVHASLLHSQLSSLDDSATATTLAGKYQFPDRAPKFHVEDTDGGILIGARRKAEEDSYYWRISRWLFPYFTMIPREPQGITQGGAMVPIDDENCWFIHVRWNPFGPLDESQRYENNFDKNIMDDGSWLAIGNRRNDYLIDREKQKTESYTGIAFIRAQDSAMTDGMGTIADRSKEHLATTDMGIIRMRRRLIKAARELEEGIEPYAASHPESFAVRSGGCVLPRDVYFTDDAGVWADINVKP